MLKKILIGVVALVVLLVIAAVAIVAFVDVNRFKPQIEQAVADRYQRKLDIGGKLSLSVFPRIALTLPATTLSDPAGSSGPSGPAGSGQTATLGGAHVSVALLPLLRGQIVADRITIDDLKARIVRRADGTLSIDDLLGRSGAGPTGPTGPTGSAGDAPASETAAGGGRLPELDIGGLTLSRARVEFDDQQAGNKAVIDQFDLETGRITTAGRTPLSLSMKLTMTQPQAAADVSFKGEADYDLNAGRYGGRGITATVKGRYDTTTLDDARLAVAGVTAEPARGTIDLNGLDVVANGKLAAGGFEAKLAAPRLKIDKEAASGETVSATVRLSGEQAIDARIEASDISGKASALSIARLAVDATSTAGPRKIVARLTTPINGDTAAGTWQLAGLAGQVVVTDPAIPGGTATLDLKGTASADTKKETARVELAASGEGTSLTAQAGVNGFTTPRVQFDVKADRLDIDRFLPPSPKGQKTAGPAPGSGSGTGSAPGAPAEAPIDLSALRTLSLDGRIAIGQLRARGLEASRLGATIKAAAGKLDVAPISASLYQGKLAASASVQAGATPSANRFGLNVDLSQIAIGPLLQAVADNDLLEGRGNVRLDARTGGGSVTALKQALDGKGAINLTNGAIRGINLAETIRSARGILQGGGNAENRASDQSKKTDFTALTATFVIQNGVATSNDLDVKSPLIRVGGEGTADLARDQLNYTVRASVVATSGGQGGKDLADLNGLTVPVRLTGPLAAPNWQIDWVTAGREMLKSRAANELKERLKVDDLENRAKDKARERVGDALKGLLGR